MASHFTPAVLDALLDARAAGANVAHYCARLGLDWDTARYAIRRARVAGDERAAYLEPNRPRPFSKIADLTAREAAETASNAKMIRLQIATKEAMQRLQSQPAPKQPLRRFPSGPYSIADRLPDPAALDRAASRAMRKPDWAIWP